MRKSHFTHQQNVAILEAVEFQRPKPQKKNTPRITSLLKWSHFWTFYGKPKVHVKVSFYRRYLAIKSYLILLPSVPDCLEETLLFKMDGGVTTDKRGFVRRLEGAAV